ncbi:hypothetical protein Peur_049112 [Populus x canadensis]
MQNCKCSFDSASLHRSTREAVTTLFPNSKSSSPTLPVSPTPFPFPQQFKKSHSLDPKRSWRDEDSAILHRQRSIPARIALLDCLTLFSVLGHKKSLLHYCINVETPRQSWIGMPFAVLLLPFYKFRAIDAKSLA